MKKKPFLIFLIITFIAEAILCIALTGKMELTGLDTVAVNECVKSVEENYGSSEKYSNTLAYTVLDADGEVVYQNASATSITENGKRKVQEKYSNSEDENTEDQADFKNHEAKSPLSNSVNEAIHNADLILDFQTPDNKIGHILFHNDNVEKMATYKNKLIIAVAIISFIQLVLILSYFIYLHTTIIDPFNKLSDFAKRIAEGNLDLPLTLDRGHIFGSFTESFDIMRSELKKARDAEKKANDDKKEMIAKLSHDIKTPIASIKSTSEIGYELTKEDRTKEFFNLINIKSDQITTLTDNLFESTIDDITEIEVNPSTQESDVVKKLIKNADYLNRVEDIEIPSCNVYIDKLRLQQAFDNVFMNSYKYANTEMTVTATTDSEYLIIDIADTGEGVNPQELPLLKEKYKRGSNSAQKDGAGLGLYLTNYFLEKMNGKLELENATPGFIVKLYIRKIQN